MPPWRGDQVRAYHHLRLLARRHDVTLCALVARPRRRRPTWRRCARSACASQVVPLGLAGALPSRCRARLVDAAPLQVLLYRARAGAARASRALGARALRRRARAARADGAPTGRRRGGPPVVLDLVDALSENFARRAARDRGPLAWVSAVEERRAPRATSRRSSRAAATLVVAGARSRVRSAAESRARRAERRRPERVPVRADGARVAGRIVFGGNLGYFPNVDAARWLVEEILPAVRAARAGRDRPSRRRAPDARVVRALAARPGVSLAADVPSMAPEIASGDRRRHPDAQRLRAPEQGARGDGGRDAGRDDAAGRRGVWRRATASIAALGDDGGELARRRPRAARDDVRAARTARRRDALVARHYRWETSAAAVETRLGRCCGPRR